MSQSLSDNTLLKRTFYLVAGVLSLIAGAIGVVLPLLPTTPFLLLAAWCFARSSHSFHTWLISHKYFGKFISDWEQHRGMTRSNKRRAYIVVVLSFSFSIYMVPLAWVKLLLVGMGLAVVFRISRLNTVEAP